MPHFNAEAFENHLSTVPDDLLIEMAEDGIITQDEIHELLEVLDVDPELAAAIERHADVVGRTILDYVEQNQCEKPRRECPTSQQHHWLHLEETYSIPYLL